MIHINWRTCLFLTVYVLFLIVFAQAPTFADDIGQIFDDRQQYCAAAPHSIDLEVRNVQSDSGVITIDVHDDNPDGFLKPHGLLSRIRTPASPQTTRVCIALESSGIYALAVYHDRDQNHVFDKNWIGLPAEPYGVSNDPPIRLGPPPHHAAAFLVSGASVPVTVTLRGK